MLCVVQQLVLRTGPSRREPHVSSTLARICLLFVPCNMQLASCYTYSLSTDIQALPSVLIFCLCSVMFAGCKLSPSQDPCISLDNIRIPQEVQCSSKGLLDETTIVDAGKYGQIRGGADINLDQQCSGFNDFLTSQVANFEGTN